MHQQSASPCANQIYAVESFLRAPIKHSLLSRQMD